MSSVRHSTWYTIDSVALPFSTAWNIGRTDERPASDRRRKTASVVNIWSLVAAAVR